MAAVHVIDAQQLRTGRTAVIGHVRDALQLQCRELGMAAMHDCDAKQLQAGRAVVMGSMSMSEMRHSCEKGTPVVEGCIAHFLACSGQEYAQQLHAGNISPNGLLARCAGQLQWACLMGTHAASALPTSEIWIAALHAAGYLPGVQRAAQQAPHLLSSRPNGTQQGHVLRSQSEAASLPEQTPCWSLQAAGGCQLAMTELIIL